MDEKPTTFVCKECGQEKKRPSMHGRPPERCQPCKDKLKLEKLASLKNTGKNTHKGYGPTKMETEAEELRAAARAKVEEEPTWLDEPEVQAQLAARNAEAIGLVTTPPETAVADDGFVIEVDRTKPVEVAPDVVVDAYTAECAAPACTTLPVYPQIEPKFCLNHWLTVNHDTRGILLGAPVGSAPWNSALIRAIGSLR